MPKSHPNHNSAAGAHRVPVALLLPATLAPATVLEPVGRTFAVRDLLDWHGLAPAQVAYLVLRYTAPGDLVLNLDQHATITAAAEYLHRHPTTLADGGRGARLILATLPSTGTSDLPALTEAFAGWRAQLGPGGFLLTVVTARTTDPVSPRSNVIAAARAAGLLYHQHIPILLAPLPDHDPTTDPHPVPSTGRPLRYRHRPAHRDLLAFTTTVTEADRD